MADINDLTTPLRLVLWCEASGHPWGVGRTAAEAMASALRLFGQVEVDGTRATPAELRKLTESGYPMAVEAPPARMGRLLDVLTGGDQVMVEVGVALGYTATSAPRGGR